LTGGAVEKKPLSYREAGGGRPLLAIHGNFASNRWYNELLASPPAGYRVIAPDLPGYGRSRDLLEEPTVASLADAVERLAEHLGLDRPVLFGHSLGGAVVLELATRDPARYRGLVLMASPSLSGYPHDPAGDPIREAAVANRAIMDQIFRMQSPGMDESRRAETEYPGILDDAQAIHPRCLNGLAQDLGRWNLSGRADALASLPVLVIAGERDPLVTAPLTEALRAQLPHAKNVTVAGAGHWVLLERPTETREALDAFLKDLP
jgi:pimeloyl-ACP methyl ester carboxylesterase